MKEWKKLDIVNLPSDILVGDYEFDWIVQSGSTHLGTTGSIYEILESIEKKGFYFRYRKKETPPLTHEEIMSKWWCINGYWVRIIAYENNHYYYVDGVNDWLPDFFMEFKYKKDFSKFESATIPPEKDQS